MDGRVDPRAGQLPDPDMLVDVDALVKAFYAGAPDPAKPAQRVAFGTSGHRGSAFANAFNEAHILAITQAICQHRTSMGVDGPLFIGFDTHALSRPALGSALEVLVANGVEVMVDSRDSYTPTPAVSHAILRHNRGRARGFSDGIIITPSHNPPEFGGIKYNPPTGGPADPTTTGRIQDVANRLLEGNLKAVRRLPYEQARLAPQVRPYDYRSAFVDELDRVVDMEAIAGSGVKLGIDPLGGAGVEYWGAIIERYRIAATVVSEAVDPQFGFLPRDWDGQLRTDCSSPYAMMRLVGLRDRFDVAFGNDADADRHGVVTPDGGLMNPNQYLAAAIAYLFAHRPDWGRDCGVGKTMVSSAMIDRVVAGAGRRLLETPVGFRWFVDGLRDASLGFAGEESAGAAFLRRDGSVWTTEKDGLSAGLLAAEITARTGRTPLELYQDLTEEFGRPVYERIDAPATPEAKTALARIAPSDLSVTELAGDPILAVETSAPDGAPLGGVRVKTRNGWFAARPSGTEPLYKIYAESFQGLDHLARLQRDAQTIVDGALGVRTAHGA